MKCTARWVNLDGLPWVPNPKKRGLWSWYFPAKRFSVGPPTKKMLFCLN